MFFVGLADVSLSTGLLSLRQWLNARTDNDVIGMFEEAFKRHPTNEDFGGQTFFANIRAGNWKAAQQVRRNIPICVLLLIILGRSRRECTSSSKKTDTYTGA